MKNYRNTIIKQTEFYVFLIILFFAVMIHIKSGLFFTNNNMVGLLRTMIVPSIYAICALLSFVSTGPDVSFPLIAALSSYLAITTTEMLGLADSSCIITFVFGMIFGGLMGALNGFIIVKYKFPSLIVTLGTSSIFSGILLGTFEAGRRNLPPNLERLGEVALLVVKNKKSGLGATLPITFLIMILLYFVTYLILNKTVVGRGIYAIGGDEVSAERAGFDVAKIRFFVFVANGAIASVAGLCYSVMSKKYLPTEFAGAEMIVIAAIILGGTRMTGGIGTLKGCFLGTLLLTMVSNSLILSGIPIFWQKVFIGAIIIIGTAIPGLREYFSNQRKRNGMKEAT